MFPGVGTLVNVLAVLVGTALGVLVGHRFHQRTRDVVTDGLGLVTLLIAGTAAMAVQDDALTDAVGTSAPMLIVLGSLIVGGVLGSVLGIEDGLERFGGWLQSRFVRRTAGSAGPAHGADFRGLRGRAGRHRPRHAGTRQDLPVRPRRQGDARWLKVRVPENVGFETLRPSPPLQATVCTQLSEGWRDGVSPSMQDAEHDRSFRDQ